MLKLLLFFLIIGKVYLPPLNFWKQDQTNSINLKFWSIKFKTKHTWRKLKKKEEEKEVKITLTEASESESGRPLEATWLWVLSDFWGDLERRLGVMAFLGELVVLNLRFGLRGGVFSWSLDLDASMEREFTFSPDLPAAATGLSVLSTSISLFRSNWFNVYTKRMNEIRVAEKNRLERERVLKFELEKVWTGRALWSNSIQINRVLV